MGMQQDISLGGFSSQNGAHLVVMIIMHKSLFCISSKFQSTENGCERMGVYVTIQALVTCSHGPDISGNRKGNKK